MLSTYSPGVRQGMREDSGPCQVCEPIREEYSGHVISLHQSETSMGERLQSRQRMELKNFARMKS